MAPRERIEHKKMKADRSSMSDHFSLGLAHSASGSVSKTTDFSVHGPERAARRLRNSVINSMMRMAGLLSLYFCHGMEDLQGYPVY